MCSQGRTNRTVEPPTKRELFLCVKFTSVWLQKLPVHSLQARMWTAFMRMSLHVAGFSNTARLKTSALSLTPLCLATHPFSHVNINVYRIIRVKLTSSFLIFQEMIFNPNYFKWSNGLHWWIQQSVISVNVSRRRGGLLNQLCCQVSIFCNWLRW